VFVKVEIEKLSSALKATRACFGSRHVVIVFSKKVELKIVTRVLFGLL
jgi:hypothetical protein